MSAAALPLPLRLRIAGTTRPHATSHGTCRQSQLSHVLCAQEHMPHIASPPHHTMTAQGWKGNPCRLLTSCIIHRAGARLTVAAAGPALDAAGASRSGAFWTAGAVHSGSRSRSGTSTGSGMPAGGRYASADHVQGKADSAQIMALLNALYCKAGVSCTNETLADNDYKGGLAFTFCSHS